MSGELHDKLVPSGINPDRVLHSTMKKAMAKFAERFLPDDAVGYAYGLHHDTDNLHIHVALCPRTAKGAYVGCSTSRTNFSGHQNQMDYLRNCFERENRRWAQTYRRQKSWREKFPSASEVVLLLPRSEPLR
jgi:MobA/VirD2-like, nuclease domain